MKRSKVIIGLRKPSQFSMEERRMIIEEYIQTGCTKIEIWKKYTSQKRDSGTLLNWMRDLGYSEPLKSTIYKREKSGIRFFSVEQRKAVIKDYLKSGKSKREIWEKHTGRTEGGNLILYWMRKLGYESTPEKANLEASNQEIMSKSTDQESLENSQLKEKIIQLEKELAESKLKAMAMETMIDVAESQLNINIRKKPYTKQSIK